MAAYSTVWLIENKVMLFRVVGAYDYQIMRDGLIALDDRLAQAAAPIYLINDMSRLSSFAKNFAEVLGEMNQRENFHKVGWMVVVTPNPLLRFFGNVASHLRGVNSRPVASLEEAIIVLQRIDPALEQAGLGKIDLVRYDAASNP